ncbi:MAG: zinc ABC transporter substrate-binding protein [Thermoplasmata archaeon]|nr:MAG: zinc ABC transporter substrate-binding protein [Thermoplasmata archaeon]
MNSKQKTFIAVSFIVVFILLGIAVFQAYQVEREEDDKVKVIATFYPLAFFAEQIGGDLVSVKALIPHNTEVHAWQPSTADIVATEDADVLLYNGVELDHWFEEDILSVIDKSDKIIVETTEGIELLATEDEGDGHDEHNEDDHEGHEHGLTDPHTWLCPYLARQQAERIYEALLQNDPDNEDYYVTRWTKLSERLEQLDENYTRELSDAGKDEIFTTHAAFGYLADRYSFEQHGVIGISADEQPSTSAISTLVDLMIEHDTYVIYVDPVYADDYAETLSRELESQTGEDVIILELYFMLGPMDGKNFFEQQEANLENLKIGLEA